MRVSELCGYFDGSYVIEDIFVYRAAGTDEQGRAQGLFYSTGYEPLCLPQLTSPGTRSRRRIFRAERVEPRRSKRTR